MDRWNWSRTLGCRYQTPAPVNLPERGRCETAAGRIRRGRGGEGWPASGQSEARHELLHLISNPMNGNGEAVSTLGAISAHPMYASAGIIPLPWLPPTMITKYLRLLLRISVIYNRPSATSCASLLTVWITSLPLLG